MNIFTNNEKQIASDSTVTEAGNVWYTSVRNGKPFGRQFRMTAERFFTEFVPVIDFEPAETETDLTAR